MSVRVFVYRLLFGNGQAYFSPLHWFIADWIACKPYGVPGKKWIAFVREYERQAG